MNFIAGNLKFLRKLKGINQSDLALHVGLNRGNITSYERGVAMPSIKTIQQLASFFELSLGDLVEKDLSGKTDFSELLKTGPQVSFLSKKGNFDNKAFELTIPNYAGSEAVSDSEQDSQIGVAELSSKLGEINYNLGRISQALNSLVLSSSKYFEKNEDVFTS